MKVTDDVELEQALDIFLDEIDDYEESEEWMNSAVKVRACVCPVYACMYVCSSLSPS